MAAAATQRFADELMALGFIERYALVRVIGSGSYGVAILARPHTTGAMRADQRADIIIKVAKRCLGTGSDSVWAAHTQEWAALAAVADVAGSPEAYEAGVLSLGPLDGPPPPGPGGLAAPAPAPAGASSRPRCHAFMTMAALGHDLWRVMRGHAPASWRATIFARHAGAMLAAVSVPHAAGVVHRDVKPENMCLVPDVGEGHGKVGGGGGGTAGVVLIDYGGGCVPGRRVRARDRLFYGTPMYASTSSLRGCAPSPWDDLDALGYCLAELWMGTLPWGDDFHSLVDNAPGGKWSITNLETMADEKERDWGVAVDEGLVPWFLMTWFNVTAQGRVAAEAAATTAAAAEEGGMQEAVPDAGVHPSHPAPCLRVFASLIRAGLCQAEAGMAIAKMGGAEE